MRDNPPRCRSTRTLDLLPHQNLLVDKNVDELDAVWHRAAVAGYSRVLLADSKLSHLGMLGDNAKHYFANLRRTKKIAADLHLKLVPALFDIGYSNDLLCNDPNLAEGVPVREALFVVHDGLATIVASLCARQDHAKEVDVEMPLKMLGSDLVKRGELLRAGVVHQNIESAERHIRLRE